MSIEHTVAKILSFEFHTFIEQDFPDPGLNASEPDLPLLWWVWSGYKTNNSVPPRANI